MDPGLIRYRIEEDITQIHITILNREKIKAGGFIIVKNLFRIKIAIFPDGSVVFGGQKGMSKHKNFKWIDEEYEKHIISIIISKMTSIEAKY
jgi:hypothetical protein